MWKAREVELAASSSASMRKHSPLVRYVVLATRQMFTALRGEPENFEHVYYKRFCIKDSLAWP